MTGSAKRGATTDSRPTRRPDAVAIVGLFLAPWVFYWPLFAPGGLRRYFEGGDFVDQFVAFAVHEVRSFAAGEIPLWNPYAYGGGPFWGDVQAAVAYPLSLLGVLAQGVMGVGGGSGAELGLGGPGVGGGSGAELGLGGPGVGGGSGAELGLGGPGVGVFGVFAALQVEAVLHFSLAGIFTYLFARRVWRSRAGALIAALAFTFGGYLTGYPPLQLAVLESAVWLPLALLGVELTVAEKEASGGARSWLGPVVLAVAWGMAVLAGHPQTALHLMYTTLAWAAWRTWPWRVGGWRPWARLGLGAGLGLGLAAAGWLPALQLWGLSNRSEASYAMLANGFPPGELLGAVLPGITKWAPLYVGVLPLLLALAAGVDALRPASGPRRTARFWLALGLVALLLSLGRHAFSFDLLYLLAPGFDLFRGQERAAYVVSFSLAMLAGQGAALWLAGDARARRLLANGAVALAALGAVLILAARPELRAPALRLTVAAGAVAALAAATAAGRLRPRWALAAAVVVVAADLYLANGAVNLVAVPPAELAAVPPISTLQTAAPQRVQLDPRLHSVESLRPNFGVLHGLEATSGASPLWLRTFETLRGLAQTDEGRWWDLMAVSHVITDRGELPRPAELVETVPETTDRGEPVPAHLYRLPQHGPAVWRSTAAEGPMTDDAALARLVDPAFDPFATVLLADRAGAGPGGGRSGVGLTAHGTSSLEADTFGDGPGWVVFSTAHYPGWRAAVDGEPAAVLRADVALVAVPVPAGQHTVRLWFTAPWVWAGLAISLAAALILAALTLASMRRR